MVCTVRCLDAHGQRVERDIDTADPAEARRQAAAAGLTVLSVHTGRAGLRRTARTLDALPFARDLCALLEAGLNLPEVLELLADRSMHQAQGREIDAIRQRLLEGQTLSAALAAVAGLVPPFLVASIRAAETSGQLPVALRRYIAYQSRIDDLRSRITQTLIYPAVVLAVGSLVVVFLMAYVVPRFAAVFAGLDVDLPAASRALLAAGRAIDGHGWLLGVALIAGVAAAVAAAGSPGGRGALLDLICRAPGVRPVVRTYRLSVFYRTLGMLLQGGMPLPAALDAAGDTLGAGGGDAARRAAVLLQTGAPLATALERSGLSSREGQRMVQVGERTGRLATMLDSVADFHDAELSQALERFGRLFEPLVMLGLGLLIGGVVILLYMPIFDLAGALQ